MVNLEGNQKFIFVTGPSESGKSGGVNYLKNNYPNEVKHLKIRNVFPEVYKEADSNLEFQTWYDQEMKSNFESLWDRYLLKAKEMSEGKPYVIMDTMYGLKSIKYLYSVLGDRLGVLYIDADFKQRVIREYVRLRTDSKISDRKADLTVTLEEVTEKTKKKDEKKKNLQTFEYKNLRYNKNGGIDYNAEGELFSYVINNNGTEKELYNALDVMIKDLRKKKLSKNKDYDENSL